MGFDICILLYIEDHCRIKHDRRIIKDCALSNCKAGTEQEERSIGDLNMAASEACKATKH